MSKIRGAIETADVLILPIVDLEKSIGDYFIATR